MSKGKLIGQGRTAEVYAWKEGQVLKLFRSDWPVEWIHNEAKVGKIICEAGMCAPKIGETIKLDGRLGIIYEQIDGSSMLEDIEKKPWGFVRVARQFADLHLSMHRDTEMELPSQRKLLKKLIRAVSSLSTEKKDRLLQRLEQLPDDNVVCHGDYHPDNILISSKGPVVIDWMSATRGNALADVAITSLLLQIASLPEEMNTITRWMFELLRRIFHSIYMRRYLKISKHSYEEIKIWFPVIAAAQLGQGFSPQEEARLLFFVNAFLEN